MRNRLIHVCTIILCLLCTPDCVHADSAKRENTSFLESFIRYYDFTTAGRYTHEYHPFLFEKSSYSLDELEQYLEKNGLPIKGRVVIAGYEEAAVPSYYTNYRVCTGSKINDEVRMRDASGWTQQLHNKFGVMTGFLFRNISHIAQQCQEHNTEPLFDHINQHVMSIYDPDSWLFQQHAFGTLLPFMQAEQRLIDWYICKNDTKKVFAELIRFWRTLYEHELQFGNRQILGTQDVLFSVAHAQHLYRSSVPLFKYYVGPDITYPIKVTSVQKVAATYNAQTFVKKFSNHMRAIDGKPTVYIFCSFVDGVGKSTLLGNVQNYKKYGNKYREYDSVDNSSSQLAQLYKYGENIFIADLPAQMSHFTYKPDGMVYFDPLAAGISYDQYGELVDFALEHKDSLIHAYKKLVQEVKTIVAKRGWSAPDWSAPELCDANDPQKALAKNLLLLRRYEQNPWIPFLYKGNQYLFHSSDVTRIRMLVKLELADSIGLKNYEPEQMLFFEGVRFPLPYNLFLDDLLTKIKEKGGEQIVFVDFLSMYPRSSRENIRINYLLQQLSLLYDSFSIEQSSYGTFVNDAQLFYRLKHDSNKHIMQSFRKEALVRLALYNTMKKSTLNSIDGVDLHKLTTLLSQELRAIPDSVVQRAQEMARDKVERETRLLERVHSKTKNFINIQELSFDDILDLHAKIQKFISRYVTGVSPLLKRKLEGDIVASYPMIEGKVDQRIALSNGNHAQLLYVFSAECKNSMILAPILRLIRTSWYLTLANLIKGTSPSGSDVIRVDKERYFVPFVYLKKTKDGKIAVLRRVFDQYKKKIPGYLALTIEFVNQPDLVAPEWGAICNRPYLLNIDRARTDRSLFAIGCDLLDYGLNASWPGFTVGVTRFVKEYKEKEKLDVVMPAADLWKKFEGRYWWNRRFKNAVDCAKENEKKQKKKKEENEKKESLDNEYEKKGEKRERDPKKRIELGGSDRYHACRFVVRALATLEMVIKDAGGEIAVRRGNKKDFVAALKLFEKVVLPTYFDLIFENDLFENYNEVKPLIKMV